LGKVTFEELNFTFILVIQNVRGDTVDEPTNDLDIETLRALENALLEFPGCAMVISHDRWFLDRIATHILDYQDEGKVEFFEGNFTEYEEYKKRTLGADALEPKRIKYKRIAK
ncbi:hypothetical protein ACUOA8_22935, partial [Escherichia sp. SS-MK2]